MAYWDKIRTFFSGVIKDDSSGVRKKSPQRKGSKFKRREHAEGPPAIRSAGISTFGVPQTGLEPIDGLSPRASFDLRKYLDHNEGPFNSSQWLEERNAEPDWISNFTSSNMSSYRYFAHEHRLQVSFHDGSIYSYYGIFPDRWKALQNAPSKGRYLNMWIEGSQPYHEDTDFPRKFRKWPPLYV